MRRIHRLGAGAILMALLCLACSSDGDNLRVETVQDPTAAQVVPTATLLPPEVIAAPSTPTSVAEATATAVVPATAVDGFSFGFAVALTRPDGGQIPVYDEPDGQRRTLVDVNAVDRFQQLNPLFAQTSFGNPLVLRVIEDDGDGWLKVQVPTRPNHSHVWVEAANFEVRSTDVWIEATISSTARSEAGELVVYRGSEPVFNAVVASGREARPTPMITGWVGQWITGPTLSPAYGSWIVDLGTYSEALGTFGGGIPLMVLHGTNQPETITARISSGALRLRNDQLDELVSIEGLLGAPIRIHSGQLGTIDPSSFRATSPATTAAWTPNAIQLIPSAL